MKTRKFLVTVMLMVFIGLTVSCSKETDILPYLADDYDNFVAADAMLILPCTTYTSTELTEAEINGLMLMREEEKLAQDVYTFFYEKYKFPIFRNIAKSESAHTAAVLRLLNFFELPDPATVDAGIFNSVEMQHLYNELTAKGNTFNNALVTGAFIEEYDIADLENLIKETNKTEIIRVYTNLRKGSINHLNVFVKFLKARGVTYTPQVLSADEFQMLIRN